MKFVCRGKLSNTTAKDYRMRGAMGTVPFDTLKQTPQKRRQKGVKRNRPLV